MTEQGALWGVVGQWIALQAQRCGVVLAPCSLLLGSEGTGQGGWWLTGRIVQVRPASASQRRHPLKFPTAGTADPAGSGCPCAVSESFWAWVISPSILLESLRTVLTAPFSLLFSGMLEIEVVQDIAQEEDGNRHGYAITLNSTQNLQDRFGEAAKRLMPSTCSQHDSTTLTSLYKLC